MKHVDWKQIRNVIQEWIRDLPSESVSIQRGQLDGLYNWIRVKPSNPHACAVEFLDYGADAGVEVIAGAFQIENESDMEEFQYNLKEILVSIQQGGFKEKLFKRGGRVVSRCYEISLLNGTKIGSLDKRYLFGLISVSEEIVEHEPYLI